MFLDRGFYPRRAFYLSEEEARHDSSFIAY
jgi:hypothetical protein